MRRHASTSPTLLARLRNPEDREAWAEFDLLYRDLILSYCRARGLQLADAEDVTQSVQASLFDGLRAFTYDPERGLFRNYLRRTVQNAIYHFLRRSSRNRERPGSDALAEAFAGGDEGDDELWEREWMHHHLRLAMQAIRRSSSPAQVEIFEKLLNGSTVEDVAAEMGLSVGAVYKSKQRVRARLRELVAMQIRNEDTCVG